jgi:hypothetical protein
VSEKNMIYKTKIILLDKKTKTKTKNLAHRKPPQILGNSVFYDPGQAVLTGISVPCKEGNADQSSSSSK